MLPMLGFLLAMVSPLVSAAEQVQASDASIKAAAEESVPANPNALAAASLIENITTELVNLIESAQTYVDEDEARFYSELGATLEKYVDFESFSRGVMGRYAGKKAMAALEGADKKRLEGQVERFTEVFRQSLINTYGKGLLVFEGERIEVVPPSEEAEEKASAGKAVIKQLIYGEREKPFEIFYSMRRGEEGGWKIRNMIVEASNLGIIYRNQFANAYKVYEGDIDKVIDNWAGGDS